jgi:SAM-dependent methyltransferase
MTQLVHHFEDPWRVAKSLARGKSITRTLFNASATRLPPLRGRVLDLGSKSRSASYFQYLRTEPGCEFVFSDLQPGEGVVAMDVERPFPLPDACFDTVLAFHLFEHVLHWDRVPVETLRILKPGGRFYVSVPFLHEHHDDPADYHRVTDCSLRAICEASGFETLHVEALGEGLLTFTSTKLAQLILPPRLRSSAAVAAYLLTTGLDRLIALRPVINGRSMPVRFALEYVAVFQKPA